MPAYTLWIIVFLFVPLALLWTCYFNTLKNYVRLCTTVVVSSTILASVWDYIGFKNGVWYFPETSVIGIYPFSLPLEEWLFLILITLLLCSLTIIAWKHTVRKTYA